MKVMIIDGQGGMLGAQIVRQICVSLEDVNITAIGTNASATAAMLKAGAHKVATGENPIVVACRKTDVIIGPVGIVIADSLMGEITEKMALAISRADAVRILIPMNKCDNLIAGIKEVKTGELIDDVIAKLKALMQGDCK